MLGEDEVGLGLGPVSMVRGDCRGGNEGTDGEAYVPPDYGTHSPFLSSRDSSAALVS
jgi:hypothetical protein